MRAFVKQNAIIQLAAESSADAERELANLLVELLADENRVRELGRRAKQLVEENVGATERTLKLLETFVPNVPGDVDAVPAPFKNENA